MNGTGMPVVAGLQWSPPSLDFHTPELSLPAYMVAGAPGTRANDRTLRPVGSPTPSWPQVSPPSMDSHRPFPLPTRRCSLWPGYATRLRTNKLPSVPVRLSGFDHVAP